MVAMVIRVLLIDDDPLVRSGLRLLLGGNDDIEIVGDGSDGDEVPALVEQCQPDVVLMDVRMARVDGLTATQRLIATENPPKVIVLTTFDADDLVLRALAAGAAGFLLKDTDPREMVDAIRRVAAGEHSLSPSVMAKVIDIATKGATSPREQAAKADLASLNERERQIAVGIGRGLTNAEIAAEQFLSLASVKAAVTSVLDKLGFTNRVQVALRVHDAGLLDDADSAAD